MIPATKCIRGEGKVHQGTGYLRKSRFNKVWYAHRLAYSEANNGIPEGYHVHHLCDNKTCINPTHLVALTPQEHREVHIIPKASIYYDNLQTCKLGHPLDGKNKQQRFCPTCKTESQKKYLSQPDKKQLALRSSYAWRVKNIERVRYLDRLRYKKARI